jgi:hypothetical protein
MRSVMVIGGRQCAVVTKVATATPSEVAWADLEAFIKSRAKGGPPDDGGDRYWTVMIPGYDDEFSVYANAEEDHIDRLTSEVASQLHSDGVSVTGTACYSYD